MSRPRTLSDSVETGAYAAPGLRALPGHLCGAGQDHSLGG